MRVSPLDIVVPGDGGLLALVSLQSYAPAQVLRDPTLPAGLFDGAVDCLDLCPALVGNDVWQIRRGELLLGRDPGQVWSRRVG